MTLGGLLATYRQPGGLGSVWAVVVIATLLLAAALLVYLTGGTTQSYLHIIYVPVILAGFLFHRLGGLVAAVAAGLLLGPFMLGAERHNERSAGSTD